MGRKSSAKKQRRIVEVEDQKKKIAKKKLTATTAATTAAKKTASKAASKAASKLKRLPRQKIFGGLLAAIMLAILLVFGLPLFKEAFKPIPLADILPAKETVAFTEFNTNFEHIQLEKAKNLLEGTEYSVEETKKKIEEQLSIDIQKDVLPWLGRQVGVAELNLAPEDEKTPLTSVYFLETSNSKKSEEFLATMAGNNLSELETSKDGDTITYSFTLRFSGEDRSQDKLIFASFAENYLIISPSNKAIELLTSHQAPKLSTNEEYEKALSETPVNKIAFIFMNFEHSADTLLQKYGLKTDSTLLNSAIQPFAELFSSESAVLIARDECFVVESFLNLEEDYLSGNKNVTKKSNYDANLTAYIPDDIEVFWGGMNAEKQINRLVALLSEGNESTSQVFEGVLKNYTEKYFGASVSMEEDIYPLLQNEFALAISGTPEKKIYTLILDLENPTEDALRLQKIANNFISSGAVFEPHVETHELPDGTMAKEIVATPEELIKSESKHEETIIYEMETESKNWGVYYSIIGSKALISTNRDALIKSIAPTTSLKDSRLYPLHIAPALEDSDEVSYFDITKFWPESKFIKSLSTGREYFSSGVNAHYYIYVE